MASSLADGTILLTDASTGVLLDQFSSRPSGRLFFTVDTTKLLLPIREALEILPLRSFQDLRAESQNLLRGRKMTEEEKEGLGK